METNSAVLAYDLGQPIRRVDHFEHTIDINFLNWSIMITAGSRKNERSRTAHVGRTKAPVIWADIM
jgi:hypothetical protein